MSGVEPCVTSESLLDVRVPHVVSRRIVHGVEYLGSPLAILVFVGISMLRHDLESVMWILAGWNVYAGLWLAFAWTFIGSMTPERTQQWANTQCEPAVGLARLRPSHLVTTMSIVVLGLFGLVFAFVLFSLASLAETGRDVLPFALSAITIFVSWSALHTAYTLYYASMYYRGETALAGTGFDFVGGDQPELVDFAYVAFTIGTTFGTSDVEVTTSLTRKHVLVHTLLSFWFTTGVLAFGVNFAVTYG